MEIQYEPAVVKRAEEELHGISRKVNRYTAMISVIENNLKKYEAPDMFTVRTSLVRVQDKMSDIKTRISMMADCLDKVDHAYMQAEDNILNRDRGVEINGIYMWMDNSVDYTKTIPPYNHNFFNLEELLISDDVIRNIFEFIASDNK